MNGSGQAARRGRCWSETFWRTPTAFALLREIGREACAASVTECQKPKALKRLSAGFIEQFMGNIMIKEPIARRFPKIVGFQTAIRVGFNPSECIVKPCRYTI
jgi:hypothetical protein